MWGEGNDFWLSCKEIKKIKGVINQDSTVHVLSKAGEQLKKKGMWEYVESLGRVRKEG